jgi:hypothetical protein
MEIYSRLWRSRPSDAQDTWRSKALCLAHLIVYTLRHLMLVDVEVYNIYNI